ncbi:MAG: NAD-binding protein [Armatimonadetes bacterium]|nr:NAD-binding protein [Akkermansiaceae bacterium]
MLLQPITIIGGGLTGLSLAIALRKNGIPVILHEAGIYPRHRVCGEFISGILQKTLNALGIADLFHDCRYHTDFTWFSANQLLRQSLLPTPALGISRYVLDDRLQKLATDLGVEIKTRSRQKPDPGKAGLIWTAGRKPVKGEWLGLKAHLRDLDTSQHLEMHNGPFGYLGIAPIEDGLSNVCGLFKIDRTISQTHQNLLVAYLSKNGNTHLAKKFKTATWRENSFTAVAGFELGRQIPTPGILSLGDSYAIIPPYTGNGMTMAFQSAEIALPHLLTFSRNQTPWSTTCAKIEKKIHEKFHTRLTASKFLHPFLLQPKARTFLKHLPLRPILKLVR